MLEFLFGRVAGGGGGDGGWGVSGYTCLNHIFRYDCWAHHLELTLVPVSLCLCAGAHSKRFLRKNKPILQQESLELDMRKPP